MVGSVAQTLYENTADRNPHFIELEGGIRVVFPYQAHYHSVPPYQTVPLELMNIYNTGMSIWSRGQICSAWVEFLEEVDLQRKEKGIENPINVLGAINQLLSSKTDDEGSITTEHPELFTRVIECLNNLSLGSLEIENINEDEFIFPDSMQVLLNKGLTVKLINFFLENKTYNQLLFNSLISHIPNMSADWVDTWGIEKFLENFHNKSPIILDIGSGYGTKISRINRDGRKVIGIDMQYINDPDFEDNYGYVRTIPLIQAEAQSLPFSDNSTDIVTMIAVVGHISLDALKDIEVEIRRVLKEGGIWCVGPQNCNDSDYRFFKKDDNFWVEIDINGELVSGEA